MFKHYPKLSAILLTYPLAIFIFSAVGPEAMHLLVEPFGIGGILVAGALYTYGFTASAAMLILPSFLPDYPVIFIALLGGVGATLADLTIFRLLKGNLRHEIDRVRKIPSVRRVIMSPLLKPKLMRDIVGFLIIMSPFPDEIGITFLSLARMDEPTFRIVSFAANVIGIYLLASAGTLIY